MATKVEERVLDDLHFANGQGEEVLADETVRFGLDGKSYEIDLTRDNADKLRAALDVYVNSAKRSGSAGHAARRNGTAPSGTKRGDRERSQRIREWARGQGGEFGKVSKRGRIPADIQEAYEVAHPDDLA